MLQKMPVKTDLTEGVSCGSESYKQFEEKIKH